MTILSFRHFSVLIESGGLSGLTRGVSAKIQQLDVEPQGEVCLSLA
jgi:hypothetical protein